MTPKLTIVTPSLNQADFIERTLRSVIEQGYPNLEYIVVDGGSTDGSVEIIERYADHLSWWESEPDRGQTHAINKGMARATGEIVAYINSDDYYLPGAFTTAVRRLEESGAGWLSGACRFLHDDGRLDALWVPEHPRHGRHRWILEPWGVPQAATFWRREMFERYGKFREDMHYAFDTEFGLRLALAGEIPECISTELAVRFLHDEAKSADMRPFRAEMRRYARIFRDDLTVGERSRLAARRVATRAGYVRLRRGAGVLKRRLTGSPVATQSAGILTAEAPSARECGDESRLDRVDA